MKLFCRQVVLSSGKKEHKKMTLRRKRQVSKSDKFLKFINWLYMWVRVRHKYVMELANGLDDKNAVQVQDRTIFDLPEESKRCEIWTFLCIITKD